MYVCWFHHCLNGIERVCLINAINNRKGEVSEKETKLCTPHTQGLRVWVWGEIERSILLLSGCWRIYCGCQSNQDTQGPCYADTCDLCLLVSTFSADRHTHLFYPLLCGDKPFLSLPNPNPNPILFLFLFLLTSFIIYIHV